MHLLTSGLLYLEKKTCTEIHFVPPEPATGLCEPPTEMVDRGKGYPTEPDRDHWCYPGILWKLDADLTAQPLCFVIPASFHFELNVECCKSYHHLSSLPSVE